MQISVSTGFELNDSIKFTDADFEPSLLATIGPKLVSHGLDSEVVPIGSTRQFEGCRGAGQVLYFVVDIRLGSDDVASWRVSKRLLPVKDDLARR
jgi:hypothetical protein